MSKHVKKSVVNTLQKILREIDENPDKVEKLFVFVKKVMLPPKGADNKLSLKELARMKQQRQALFKYYNNKVIKRKATRKMDLLRNAFSWTGYRGVNLKTKKSVRLLGIPVVVNVANEHPAPPIVDRNALVDVIGESLVTPPKKADGEESGIGIFTTGKLVSHTVNDVYDNLNAQELVKNPICYPLIPAGTHLRFYPVMFELENDAVPVALANTTKLEVFTQNELTRLGYKVKQLKVLPIAELFDMWNIYHMVSAMIKEQAAKAKEQESPNFKHKEDDVGCDDCGDGDKSCEERGDNKGEQPKTSEKHDNS